MQDMPDGEKQEGDERTIAHLLIDQIEFANVILLNKTDLIDKKYEESLKAFLNSINPNAEVISTREAKVPFLLNTLYQSSVTGYFCNSVWSWSWTNSFY